MPVAVVGNLSLDLVDDGPPRVGGPPYYALRALRALAVPAMVRVKCAPADRPAFEPAFRDVGIEWLPGSSTATYAFSYDGDVRTMEVRTLGDPWSPADVEGLGADWVHVGSLEERALSALGVPEVVVTFGSRGSVVVARRALVHVPAELVGETDPTGAGDAFAAAYVVARSRGHAPRRAAERATRVVSRLLTGAAR